MRQKKLFGANRGRLSAEIPSARSSHSFKPAELARQYDRSAALRRSDQETCDCGAVWTNGKRKHQADCPMFPFGVAGMEER